MPFLPKIQFPMMDEIAKKLEEMGFPIENALQNFFRRGKQGIF